MSLRYLIANLLQKSKKYKRKHFDFVGENIVIQRGCIISHPRNMQIHDNVYIGSNCKLYTSGGLVLCEGVVLGSNITILTANHNYDSDDLISMPYDNRNDFKKVIVEKHSWIGLNSTILPGITIGECSVIAAGSVVTRNVPSYSVVGGNPAKVIKYRKRNNYGNIRSWLELNKTEKKYYHYRI